MTNFTFAGSRKAIARWILDQPDLNTNIITSTTPQARIDMDADDPWDWAIDRLVEELCTEKRTWQPSSINASRPDPAKLETKLRENEVVGKDILLELDDAVMKNDFEITKLGHRAWLRDAIRILRLRSPAYHSYVQRHNMSIGSFQPPSHHGYPSPSIQAPNAIAIAAQLANSDQALPMLSGLTPHYSDELHMVDAARKPSDFPIPGETYSNHAVSIGDESPSGRVLDDDDVVEDPFRKEAVEDDTDATRVNRKVTIIDVDGKQRKRLAPTLITSTIPERDRSIPTHADGVVSFNPAKLATPPPPAVRPENPLEVAATVTSQRNCSIPTDADEVVIIDPEKVVTPPPPVTSPGKPYVDVNGKKRLIPIVQSDSTVSEPTRQENSIHDNVAGAQLTTVLERAPANSTSSKSDISGTKDRTANAQISSYLDRKKLVVDDIFYSGTELGGDASLPEVSFEFNNAPTEIPSGRRLYVHNMMKRFLRSKPVTVSRGGQKILAVIPYSPDLRPKFSDISFTLYRPVDGIIKTTRESLDSWPELSHKATVDKLNVVGQEGQFTFNPMGPGMVVLHNKIASDDWDPSLLNKYLNVEGGDDILPIYGESGSDNDYDEQTWREMEKDKGVDLKRQPGKSRKPPISTKDLELAVDEAITSHVVFWKEKKLPKFQHKAYRLWRKSRKQKTRKQDIAKARKTTDTLNERLEKMRQAILKEGWTSKNQVLKQATILEGTVFDREASKWEFAVLESKDCPEKPAKAAPKVKASTPIRDEEGESIGTEAESSSSADSLDDFIASEDSGSEEQHELSMADAEVTDDDEKTLSDASISESPMTPTKKIKIFIKDSKFRSPSESASPEALPVGTPIRPKREESQLPKYNSTKTFNPRDVIELSSDDNRVIYNLVTPTKKMPTLILRHTPPERAKSGAITITDDDTGTPSPRASQVIQTNSIENGRLSFKDWETRKDRRGLLIAVFQKMVPELHRRVFNIFSSTEEKDLWFQINSVLSACEIEDAHISGMDASSFELIKIIVGLYEIYIECKYRRYNLPLRKAKVPSLRHANVSGTYGDFFRLCLEIASFFDATAKRSPTATSSKTAKKRKQPHLSDQEDASDEDEDEGDEEPISAVPKRRPQLVSSMSEHDLTPDDTPRKKRKKLLENSDARDLREQNLARNAEQDERRKRLRLKLSQSGHGNDEARGQIIINDAKSDDQGYILVNQDTAPRIKNHQIEGVRFMWNQIVGDDEAMQGCLLAHTMGLGKTMQVITLLVAIAEASASPDPTIHSQIPPRLRQSRTLVLCPPGLVDNWVDELLTWAPNDLLGPLLKVDAALQIRLRIGYIVEWYEHGGVLVIGYDMFRSIIHNKPKAKRPAPYDDDDHAELLKALLEGPNIIIADEAHKLKNHNSKLAAATAQFKSMSRIALTGSPLANNVTEYHTMIDWVAPNYLGPISEFRQKYVEPIELGLWMESTGYERRRSLKMLGVLKEDIAPKVHRADMSVLRNDLPPKKEFIIFVPLTDLQKKAYSLYVQLMLSGEGYTLSKSGELTTATLWHWLAVLQLLCNHPACFHAKLNDRKSDAKEAAASQEKLIVSGEVDGADDVTDAPLWKAGVSNNLVKSELRLFEQECDDMEMPGLSNKVSVLCKILDAAREIHDKVLVFSQSIPTLNFLENLLRSQRRKIARLDGDTVMGKRQAMTKAFNTDETEIYLISTTAGGLGLNLPGANRVVIFDFKFNPVEEEQAIGRAYRIGQKKPTFVYRLMCSGTFEEVIHNKTIFKTQLASQVVDKKSVIASAKKKMSEYLFEPKAVEPVNLSEFAGMDSVLDKILLSQEGAGMICKVLQSDSFSQDDTNVLTPEELKEVKAMISSEHLKRTNPKAYAAKLVADAADMQARAQAEIQRRANRLLPQPVQPLTAIGNLPQSGLNSTLISSRLVYESNSTPVLSPASRESRIIPGSQPPPSNSLPSTSLPGPSNTPRSTQGDMPSRKDSPTIDRQPGDPILPPSASKQSSASESIQGRSPILGPGTRIGSPSPDSTLSQTEVLVPRANQSAKRPPQDVTNVCVPKRLSSPPSVTDDRRAVKHRKLQASSDVASRHEFLQRKTHMRPQTSLTRRKATKLHSHLRNHASPPTPFSKFKSTVTTSSDAGRPSTPTPKVQRPEQQAKSQVQPPSQPTSTFAAMSKKPSVSSLKTSVMKPTNKNSFRNAADEDAEEARRALERRRAHQGSHRSARPQSSQAPLPQWARDELNRSASPSRRESMTGSSQRSTIPSFTARRARGRHSTPRHNPHPRR